MYLKLMANFLWKQNDCGYWKAVALDNGRIYDVADGNKDSSMEFSIDEKVKEVNGEFVVK